MLLIIKKQDTYFQMIWIKIQQVGAAEFVSMGIHAPA